jgi:hypothetical protein
MTNDEIRVLTAEVDQLHARRDKQNDKLDRAVEAHRVAEQDCKQLFASDLDDNDARLVRAIKHAADARLAADASREALGVTQHKLDDAEQRLATAKDARRRVEIVKAIDTRLEQLEQRRQDLDKAARAFGDLLADGSAMGRGVAAQVMTGLSLSDGPFADLLSATRNYRERIRSGMEPLPTPAPTPAQRQKLNSMGDENAAHA